jgi:hypothetical protein
LPGKTADLRHQQARPGCRARRGTGYWLSQEAARELDATAVRHLDVHHQQVRRKPDPGQSGIDDGEQAFKEGIHHRLQLFPQAASSRRALATR